jgi:uncharacterized protein (DUF433 family)
MNKKALLARITQDPEIFGGKPIIRGKRIAVEHIMSLLRAGDTRETLLRAYPLLEPDDIAACLLYEQEHQSKHAAHA